MEWCPPLSEVQILDRMFQQLDITREGRAHAKEAVPFLRMSNLNKDILSKLWSWMDVSNSLVIDRYQFYKIMRLISVLQSPMYANYTPNSMNELYISTATQSFRINPSTPSTQEIEWCPPLSEVQILDRMFQQLDITREGRAHAKEAVPFLRMSNLNKDILSKLWSWMDVSNSLVIDRYQFYKIMRLISVLQSPMYANYTPNSMNELYISTVTQQFILPIISASTPVTVKIDGCMVNVPLNVAPNDILLSNFITASTTPVISASSVCSSSVPVDDSIRVSQIHKEIDLICLDSPENVLGEIIACESTDNAVVSAASPTDPQNEEDEIGDFMSASTLKEKGLLDGITASLTPVKPVTESSNLVKTNSNSNMAAVHIENNYGKANERISVFDEIVEMDLRAQNEDWDDFAEATNASNVGETYSDPSKFADVVTLLSTDATAGASLDNIGDADSDFGDFESAKSCEEQVKSDDSVIELSVTNVAEQVGVTVDDPFASIEPHVIENQFYDAASSVSSKLDDNLPVESGVEETCEVSKNDVSDRESYLTQIVSTGKVDAGSVNIEADDVGDFGSFAAAIEQPVQFVDDNTSRNEIQAEVDVIVDGETESGPPNLGRASSASLISDLFEFDEPDPTPALIVPPLPLLVNISTSIKSNNIAPTNILDLFDTLPVTASNAPSAPVSMNTIDAGYEAEFDANFDAFQSAPTIEDVAQSKTDTSNTVFSTTINTAVTNPASGTNAFTISELEVLSVTLSEKFLYEEAYQCILNALYVREIYELTEEKKMAVERDDLVLAIELKNKINQLNSKLVSIEEEQKWYNMAHYGGFAHIGESIEQMTDLARSFDSNVGNRYARKYIDNTPDPFTPLPQRMRFYASAKRCIKVITALYTTHNSLVAYWREILPLVEECISTSESKFDQFNRLEVIDQNILLATEKMKSLIEASLYIARVGLYVAASCIEGMLEEEIAMTVAAKITSFVSDIQPIWARCKEINSLKSIDLPILTLGDILDSALENSATTGLEYCNLTLRPLVTRKSGALNYVFGSTSITINSNGVDCSYLREAYNFVTHYLGELPVSDETFR